MRDAGSWEAQDVPRSTPRLQSILETVHCWRYFQDTRYQLVIKSPQGLPALGISRIWAILGSLGSVFNSGGARRRLLGKLGVP
jgi:uncharacterized protein YjiS (DUF1127 family)